MPRIRRMLCFSRGFCAGFLLRGFCSGFFRRVFAQGFLLKVFPYGPFLRRGLKGPQGFFSWSRMASGREYGLVRNDGVINRNV